MQWLNFRFARGSSQQRQRKTNIPPIFSGEDMLKLMKDRCREMTSSRRRRQLSVTELLRHGRIVTDPEKLACLDAEVARRKGKAEGDRLRAKPEPAP
jgi:hypothetical protein